MREGRIAFAIDVPGESATCRASDRRDRGRPGHKRMPRPDSMCRSKAGNSVWRHCAGTEPAFPVPRKARPRIAARPRRGRPGVGRRRGPGPVCGAARAARVKAAWEVGADVEQGRWPALRARPASRPHGSWAPTWNRAGGRDAGSWQLKGMAGETHEYSRTPQSSEKKSFPLCKPSAAAAAKSCYDRSCGVGFWGSFRPGLVPLVFLGKYSPLSPEKPCSSTSSSAPAKPGIWAGW